MSWEAIVMMIIGIVVIWGGLIASIYYAMKRSKNS